MDLALLDSIRLEGERRNPLQAWEGVAIMPISISITGFVKLKDTDLRY